MIQKINCIYSWSLHNHGKKMKQANPIMAVIQSVEMNPPMHICLCLWRSLISLTLFMKSSIPPSISLTFSKSDCSWGVIDFIIFVDFSRRFLLTNYVWHLFICCLPMFKWWCTSPSHAELLFMIRCQSIFCQNSRNPSLGICMDLQNVNGFYFKIWAILYTEIYVLLILDQAGPSTLFRY